MKIIIDLNMATLLNRNTDKEALKHFVVEKEVHDLDSLHELAISVMKESGVQEYIDYINNKNHPTPVVIFLKSEKISNVFDAWENKTQGLFGIKYRINSDETIRLLEGYQPLSTDITFS